jgi:hypothetical protein
MDDPCLSGGNGRGRHAQLLPTAQAMVLESDRFVGASLRWWPKAFFVMQRALVIGAILRCCFDLARNRLMAGH